MSAARLDRRARWAPWLLLSVFLLVMTSAGAARAHSELVSSTPADGARVAVAPRTAILTFNEEISPSFVEVVVAGPDGQARKADAATKGAIVTVELPALAAGRTEVRYRVVSKDGHPITGQIAFSAAAAAPTSGTAVAAATTGSTSGAPSDTASTSDRGVSGVAYGLIALVSVAVAVVGAVLLLVRRRGRRTRP